MIGYYVHHVGSGHTSRALAVAAAYRALTGDEVVGLGSRPRPDGWVGPWVRLVDDTDGITWEAPGRATPRHEQSAGGSLHFAPLRTGAVGFGERQRQVAAWVAAARPEAVVVDVSVEVVALVRLLGVPVVTVAMPGDRTDAPHRLGYDLASAVVACWPAGAHPDHVVAHGELAARTTHVGGVPHPDGTDPGGAAAGSSAGAPARGGVRDAALGVVLWGHGSDAPGAEHLAALEQADPGVRWALARDLPPTAVRALLRRAGTVVTHAGQGAVADVATAGTPAVVLPQPRPHDEQVATARALGRMGLAATPGLGSTTGEGPLTASGATSGPSWPAPGEWPGLLARARAMGGGAWGHWLGSGAAGIAQVVAAAARPGEQPAGPTPDTAPEHPTPDPEEAP